MPHCRLVSHTRRLRRYNCITRDLFHIKSLKIADIYLVALSNLRFSFRFDPLRPVRLFQVSIERVCAMTSMAGVETHNVNFFDLKRVTSITSRLISMQSVQEHVSLKNLEERGTTTGSRRERIPPTREISRRLRRQRRLFPTM